VFSGGLHAHSTVTVVRAKGGQVLMTDGQFTERKERRGGFTLIDDLDLESFYLFHAVRPGRKHL
jgi:hypothetical protein